ncbi:Sir2 family NAD-dependent protein deacetylase [Psychrobacillus antarcticus]|uniref:Sir2 family NAD-dependent protein deacetylase n=1 Tax=Psychrobacillus antarcticus TaxID=2879115 RepID=UPI002407EF98|nr:Sir2 family NAD-dependent protein deacetylase [Psychrobacillus antarcticus]
MFDQLYQDHIETLLQKIEEADAIVVGGAAGMSAAAGYNWYKTDEAFLRHFGKFAEKYNIESIFYGFYYNFSTREERWAYIASLIKFVNDSKAGHTYLDLLQLIQEKDYFIVTTNQDTQFSKAFSDKKVSTFQGDWRYFQCSGPCHDQVYDNKDQIEKMYANIEGTRIPTDLIPKCPKCGQDMEPWVRSRVFLEGSFFRSEITKYQTYIMKNKYKKILFLELGVGTMTPMFIKEPFWEMTYSLPNAYYISINPEDAMVPREIEEKGLAISEGIARVFQDALKEKSKIGRLKVL